MLFNRKKWEIRVFVFVKIFGRVCNKMRDPCAAPGVRSEHDLITVSLTQSLCSYLLGNIFPQELQQQTEVKR